MPGPLRDVLTLRRLADQLPLVGTFAEALPLPTLAFRLAMLLEAAERAPDLPLERLKVPVDVFASTDDRVLPSRDEGRRLARRLPNAKLTLLRDSGHVPLLEARVDIAVHLI